MIRVNDVKLPLNYTENTIKQQLCRILKIDDTAICHASLHRLSVDSRRKNNIFFVAAIDAHLYKNETAVVNRCKSLKISLAFPYVYNIPKWTAPSPQPVIIGTGPAGLFAGLILAQAGANPILIEMGEDVDKRREAVRHFWATGKLNADSNVQFGEGGAGTFSDGKLTTGINDPRTEKVIMEFIKHGAPEEIRFRAQPHIGTDYLINVVKSIRNEIISLGGKVLFKTKLTDIEINNKSVRAAVINRNGHTERIETEKIIMAIGHSARDTFEMLNSRHIEMSPKAFSVGVRIEHLREKIDESQYGTFASHKRLGPASYKLHEHLNNGRGVYTFCMCPGGNVIAAASEPGGVVTNGMSLFSRDGLNSNSAILVSAGPEDFQSDSVLAGMYFQRKLEHRAFEAGGGNYRAPIQRVCDFINRKKSNALGAVYPSYKPGFEFADLNDCLEYFISETLRNGLSLFDRKIHGFADGDSILTGIETRSSSPVRILRDPKTLESVSVSGLFPCGEGAGYAGGIISAAVDGIKCAERLAFSAESGRHSPAAAD